MPELPEVGALADGLTQLTAGRMVVAVRLRSASAVKTYRPPLESLVGRVIGVWSRHGKFLDMPAGDLHLVVHLARAGWIHWRQRITAARPSLRGPLALQVELEDGTGLDVTEQGTEKRLAIYLVDDLAAVPGIARLGVDVLDPSLDAPGLAELLRSQRGQLKTVLADQSVLAGVGNAYSDEVLHAARLSPFRSAASLSPDEVTSLHAALRSILSEALSNARGVDIGDLKPEKRLRLRVHGRAGEACPACGDTIREVSLATRSFQYCPTCQTEGRILADRRLSRLLK